MSDFRELSDRVLASPQLSVGDIEAARSHGVSTIINNRPEGEAADQTPGPAIQAAAEQAGMDYIAIPIEPGHLGEGQARVMADALSNAQGKILAYCRSGTRSTLLWALAKAMQGEPIEPLAAAAAAAGYDISPVLPAMTELAARTKS